jgi:hypothetical protein
VRPAPGEQLVAEVVEQRHDQVLLALVAPPVKPHRKHRVGLAVDAFLDGALSVVLPDPQSPKMSIANCGRLCSRICANASA